MVYATGCKGLNIGIFLVLNRYSSKFIMYYFEQFFRKYNTLFLYNELDSEKYKHLDESTKINGKQNQPKQQQLQSDNMNGKVTIEQKQINQTLSIWKWSIIKIQ